MPDTIDKRAEELADKIMDECYEGISYDCPECGWGNSNFDILKATALIAAALRKYVRRAVDRYWLMGSSEARARAVEEIFSED